MLTQELLKHYLHYDELNGVFTWKFNRRGINAGEVAGHFSKRYVAISVNSRLYYAHRLAWLYVYGSFPKGQIDHINRNKLDNRIVNLRDIEPMENQKNMCLRKNNSSGFNGVYFCRNRKKFVAQITINRKTISLGAFENVEDAINVRKVANAKYGFYKTHGT